MNKKINLTVKNDNQHILRRSKILIAIKKHRTLRKHNKISQKNNSKSHRITKKKTKISPSVSLDSKLAEPVKEELSCATTTTTKMCDGIRVVSSAASAWQKWSRMVCSLCTSHQLVVSATTMMMEGLRWFMDCLGFFSAFVWCNMNIGSYRFLIC